MHELSLAYNVMELVKRELSHCGGGELQGVEISVGTLSGVDLEAFEFAMEVVLAHTAFSQAELKIKRVEARAECRECGKEFVPATLYTACPRCGSFDLRFVAGQEFKLTALTIEPLCQAL